MTNDVGTRILIGVVLVGVLGGLVVVYEAQSPEHSPYPTSHQLRTDWSGHVGEQLYVWTRVVEIEETHMVVRAGEYEMTVEPVATEATLGDVVQVYGTIRPNHRVTAERLIVSKQSKRTYMFGVSAMAVVVTTGLLLLRWRLDRERVVLTQRRG